MEFVDFSGHAGFQEAAEDTGLGAQHFNSDATSHDQSQSASLYPNLQHSMSCDIKPRLTKEQHDILEAHFQKQNKPNTNIKKGFADSLGVSLDKVNNWFQNRRAKSKQDAKKQANSQNLYQAQHPPFTSDSEASPFLTSPDYISMMEQWSHDNQMADGLGISQMQQSHPQVTMSGLPLHNGEGTAERFQSFSWPLQMQQNMFDSPQEMNRRTLTQEQFDAFAQNGGMVNGAGDFNHFQTGFPGDPDIWHQVFPQLQHDGFKQQDLYSFPHPAGAPLSSNDSTVPSIISEQSMPAFPPPMMQQPATVSASSSEWGGSQSSSLAAGPHDTHFAQMSASRQPPAATTSQWQPGQSVPIDVNALNEEFRQVAAAHAVHGHSSPPRTRSDEQPLAWPADEAYARRDSQASLVAQSMSHVGLHTPQPNQSAAFKSPAPPSSIAARRQRARPAPLGLASLRSQSYSSAAQPGSPGHPQQQPGVAHGQPVRRVKSSNIINGVTQGRIMKSMPGSGQRSPLNFTFADAMNSPNLVRNLSHGNLAPPTPLSASEFPRPEHPRQFPSWQASSHVGRQPSISEDDFEHGMSRPPIASVPARNFTSPSHTQSYWQPRFPQHRVGSHVITENTPPASAPASQSSFATNVFATSHHPIALPQNQSQAALQQQMQAMAMSQPHHQMQASPTNQQYQLGSTVTFAPNQQANVSSGPPSGIPLQFAHGVPVVNAEGNVEMGFPPQLQLLQQQQAQMQMQAQAQAHQTSPQPPYSFMTTVGGSPGMPVTANPPKSTPLPTSDFFVHEYSPPDSMKCATTPRKTVDTAPKNYTFANTGLAHFEDKKGRKLDSSCSPASSNGAISSSSS